MIRRTSAIVVLCIASATFAPGQVTHDLTAEPQTILLWQNGAPGALGQGEDDQPTITVYRPWGITSPARRSLLFPAAVMDSSLPTTKAGK